MRTFAAIATLAASVFCGSNLHAQEATQILKPPPSAKKLDPASYGVGYQMGMELSSQGLKAEDFVGTDLVEGILDALNAKQPRVQQQAVQAAMQIIAQKVQARMAERQKQMEAMAKENLVKAKAFLEKNKKADGVQTTASGLQYKVLKSGNGATPTEASTAVVHYEGKLINGEIFDSSIKRGTPAEFPVTGVIKGWTEALLRMKVGDKYQLFIPPELAYGERGSPGGIGPNEALIFEVELLQVK